MSALGRLVAEVDPALAAHAVPDPGPGRFEDAGTDRELALVLEAVHEGYLLHYGKPRAFAGMDPDLRLLAGDALYALGLERLAARGDTGAVAELADLISLCAWSHAEGRPELAEVVWEASARRISEGAGAGARAAVAGRLGSD